jgi:general L-amino acid transport system permease protein
MVSISLPVCIRVIPPTVAIGYMDVVATVGGITLMQTGKEMETMIVVLLTYLTFSLIISAFMNWYNKKMALVER